MPSTLYQGTCFLYNVETGQELMCEMMLSDAVDHIVFTMASVMHDRKPSVVNIDASDAVDAMRRVLDAMREQTPA